MTVTGATTLNATGAVTLTNTSNDFSSVGVTSQIGYTGTPSLASQDLILTSFTGVAGTVGIHIYSDIGEASVPFANGFLCIASPFQRGPGHVYDGFGIALAPITVEPDDVGNTRWFQFWYRDGGSSNLTDGLEVAFQ